MLGRPGKDLIFSGLLPKMGTSPLSRCQTQLSARFQMAYKLVKPFKEHIASIALHVYVSFVVPEFLFV